MMWRIDSRAHHLGELDPACHKRARRTAANTIVAAPRVKSIHPGVLRYLREIGLAR